MVANHERGSDPVSSLIERERAAVESARMMTIAGCVIAVLWVFCLSFAPFELPEWVRPVSSVGLALWIVFSALRWWVARRTLAKFLRWSEE